MRVDTSFASNRHDYRYTEIHHLGSHIVRIIMCRDFYRQQSFAHAEVLSEAKTWTLLVTEPASTWHEQSPNPEQAGRDTDQARRLCQRIAGLLLDRVQQVLIDT